MSHICDGRRLGRRRTRPRASHMTIGSQLGDGGQFHYCGLQADGLMRIMSSEMENPNLLGPSGPSG